MVDQLSFWKPLPHCTQVLLKATPSHAGAATAAGAGAEAGASAGAAAGASASASASASSNVPCPVLLVLRAACLLLSACSPPHARSERSGLPLPQMKLMLVSNGTSQSRASCRR